MYCVVFRELEEHGEGNQLRNLMVQMCEESNILIPTEIAFIRRCSLVFAFARRINANEPMRHVVCGSWRARGTRRSIPSTKSSGSNVRRIESFPTEIAFVRRCSLVFVFARRINANESMRNIVCGIWRARGSRRLMPTTKSYG